MLKGYINEDDGAVLIEAALVLPLMIALGACTADAGYMLLQNHRIETQLSAAGRYLASSDNPENFETIAKRLATTGKISGGNALVPDWSASDINIQYKAFSNEDQTLYRGADTIRVVHLETSLDYKGLGVLQMFFKDLKISSSYQERIV